MALHEFEHGLDEDRATAAELVLSELVTNAVRYGGNGAVKVRFDRLPGRFRGEVVDQGDGFPVARRQNPDVPGGWGLPLVDALADRWGSHVGSTHVWFELKR
jgi:anti-sigma regulatory factor (Ser/Thr protein kinase)